MTASLLTEQKTIPHNRSSNEQPSDDIPTWAKSSPWLDERKSNLFRYEFQLARENSMFEGFVPNPIYKWIHRHGGEQLFFNGLARLAPMFSVIAYHGEVAVWTSPPPSGHGNAIYMVMGHDSDDHLRLVGGNYFTEPKRRVGSPITDIEFFRRYDSISDDAAERRRKEDLVRETVLQSISREDESYMQCVIGECEHSHTMPICITVLTPTGSLFHVAKAVVEGTKPTDFSREYFGEVQ
jgi:hypothetical protein